MNNLLEYYKKVEYPNGNIVFEKVKEEDIKICGYSLTEIIDILQALELEKITEIKFCRENINKYIELYNKEQEKIQKDILDNMFKNNFLFEESDTNETNS